MYNFNEVSGKDGTKALITFQASLFILDLLLRSDLLIFMIHINIYKSPVSNCNTGTHVHIVRQFMELNNKPMYATHQFISCSSLTLLFCFSIAGVLMISATLTKNPTVVSRG